MIHCIGNSHVSLFNESGEKNDISTVGSFPFTYNTESIFRTYNIGPALAYNTSENGHPSNVVFNMVINTHVKKDDIVLIALGQIDCAVHLPEQKKRNPNRKYEDIILEASQKYFNFVLELHNRIKNKIIIYGPVVAGNTKVTDYIYDDKMIAVKLFTDFLEFSCVGINGIEHISLYKLLFSDMVMKALEKNESIPDISNVDKIKSEYYYDMTHLSYTFLPTIKKKIDTLIKHT